MCASVVQFKWFTEWMVYVLHLGYRLNRLCMTDVAFLLPYRLGNLQLVQYLVGEQNCNKECTDNEGRTPLHWAVE